MTTEPKSGWDVLREQSAALDPKVKASPAKPYDGKPTWHGKYLADGAWHTVTNNSGLPIAYASPEAACAGAWLQAPDDDDEGQDRESYSDDQDRESYSAD